MYKGKTILAIIPARGGSRRLPQKNLKLLGKKPLIAHTVQAAKKCRLIDRVLVNTDDPAIAGTAAKFRAQVMDRPKKLAKDGVHTTPVILYTLQQLKANEDYAPDLIVMLQPTTPLRSADDIEQAIKTFYKKKASSVVSVYQDSPYWHLQEKRGQVKPVLGWAPLLKQSQKLPAAYRPNGAIYISTPGALKKHGGFYQKNMALYVMPAQRSIDIDEEIDLQFANFLLKYGRS
jgi:CMP-N-acetylneuraminic acid synthetase